MIFRKCVLIVGFSGEIKTPTFCYSGNVKEQINQATEMIFNTPQLSAQTNCNHLMQPDTSALYVPKLVGLKTKQAIFQMLKRTSKQARKFIVKMLSRQAHFMNAEKSGEVSLAFVLRRAFTQYGNSLLVCPALMLIKERNYFRNCQTSLRH